ncbi:hypothetical protein OR571_11330 [Psychrobacillus sp. NEAU-3TGS]|uniref:hypothetical protein n=1 Tax=Psychrobacillus sp. NEAU-3TGS TaxID=2995412 RepID=UPI002496672C|nr:hypothetical protein [Psychrobacillus sp. NEAU-3TGS]MDI2587689.1 hypothetical protein [Psychrobacillus sp. NEAU-3TGS]
MNKNIVKQTVVAALLTSSIFSFTPVSYGKETTIQQSIDAVKLEMKKAPLYYVDPALKSVLEPSKDLYPVLNDVKKHYKEVKQQIQSSNLSSKEKKEKIKELDALYEEKITKGVIPYIDAYNYAVKYLDPILKEMLDAHAAGDLEGVEQAYHKLSYQLGSRTSILYRFTGKAPRDLLLEKYKKPSDAKRDELRIPVTIYMKNNEVLKLWNEGKKEEARKVMDEVLTLASKTSIDGKTNYSNLLSKEVKEAEALFSTLPIPTPTPTPEVPSNPSVGGGGNEEPSESSAERKLRIAKANAIVELEAYGKQFEFSEVDWSTILLIKESGKRAINNSASTKTVEQELLATKISIDQVKTKAAATLALNEVIIAAEQLLVNHVEGANVGQAVAVDRIALAQAITTAKAIYTDATNRTQADLENASAILTTAITTFESQVVKAGDATALNETITVAEQLLDKHAEGTGVGQAPVSVRETLTQAIGTAKTIYSNAASKTQADLDNASTILTTAITTFEAQVVKAGDASVLNGNITEAEQLLVNHADGTNVGQASAAARETLAQAITVAKAIYSDADNQTQAELDNANTTLTTAITTFEAQVVKAGDATALNGAITTAEQLLDNHAVGTGVGQASASARETFEQAITVAKAIQSNAASKTQADLDNASTILTTAITTFGAQVVKAGDAMVLTRAITEAEQLLVNHTEGTGVGQASSSARETFEQAITVAKAIHSNAASKTQADLDNASTILTTAITTFGAQVVKAGDAMVLTRAITEAEQLLVNHTEGTGVGQASSSARETFEQAITVAKAIHSNAASKTQADLDNASTILTTAIMTFETQVIKAGDATVLTRAITEAEQLLVNHKEGIGVGQASAVARETLGQAITVAKAIYSDAGNQTQADLDNAITTLTSAITIFKAEVVKAGDTTRLSITINNATTLHTNAVEGVAVGQYVVGSKNVLNDAINAANLVLDNASSKTEQQIQTAEIALQTAMTMFQNSIVKEITGLHNITLTTNETNTENIVVLETNETLVVTPNDLSNGIISLGANQENGVISITSSSMTGQTSVVVNVLKDGQVIKTGTFIVKVEQKNYISHTSKELVTLDFSTTPATVAKLVSKPVTVIDFTGNRKDFSLRIQTADSDETIPISLYWALSREVSVGAAMSGIVNSAIQMHMQEKYGMAGFNMITASSWESPEYSNVFNIMSSETGSSAKLTLLGADWSYFFEGSTATGTDVDTSKNRTFTIGDGTNTAIIQLTTKFGTIDDLVNRINSRLTNAGVKAKAEKIGTTQFKITSTSITGSIIIEGADKTDFFD